MHCSAVIASVGDPANTDALPPVPLVQQGPHLLNSVMLKALPDCPQHLELAQQRDLVALVQRFQSFNSDVPSRTTVIEHDIYVLSNISTQ